MLSGLRNIRKDQGLEALNVRGMDSVKQAEVEEEQAEAHLNQPGTMVMKALKLEAEAGAIGPLIVKKDSL